MKSERELQEETSLLQAQVIPAIASHMSNEGYWSIISKLRQVHPDIEKAIDALIEHSGLEGRVQGMITVYHGRYPYMPSELAKTCYEKVYGRSLEDTAEKIREIGLSKPLSLRDI
ncbi:hypothetical protein A3F00_03400 [Candidatus Daviesbacteria bacterium RIFCSPHIGHO2_12_FULL_37_11]|uniref:Uncharacterized protein n=1 Tax=Candidatus Daviesbacteria bacterium RIFCSPHIGHO2_12_FULL_37_11 TaxID=1797777 RepID=A0A1F5KCR9_9BACT|nr:MAG: hypothetical protein A3F00_03400 [Candidatus Daviesbacteria bacterium RIFCSPHIGHO2_12_FULL_37_11]